MSGTDAEIFFVLCFIVIILMVMSRSVDQSLSSTNKRIYTHKEDRLTDLHTRPRPTSNQIGGQTRMHINLEKEDS